ncbi:DMT family transporter [Aureivirga sp. CE67]|uniref:DMT family transporter n=1 Tax=Aureivirga sp. CE67 TaxID=1788983 RepID=UPI0018C9A536|nr:DMT family transporter [Aureivirga sp. CE67]
MSQFLKAHLAVFLAYIFLAINLVVSKILMPDVMDPSSLLFLRIIASLPFLVIFYILNFQKVAKKDIGILILCSVLGIVLDNAGFYFGLNLTSPIDATIIMTLAPIFTLIISVFLKFEKLNTLKILGIALGAIGAILLITHSNESSKGATLSGNLIFLGASIVYGLYVVFSKPLIKKYNAQTVLFWLFAIGTIFIFPTTINSVLEVNWSEINFGNYLLISYTVILGTVLSYLLAIYSLKHLAPSTSASYIYIQPIIVFLSVIIIDFFDVNKDFKNDISWIKISSCLIVFGGIVLIIRARVRELKKEKV